ncbi:cob(I)yrinic acid a,c-diamide adenosyltransferase [Desulfomonile tiedjei]|uniref:corrinoid adenosyltransferase n=1 Tax=Desulfomonile tiedjei (strain ATCC 49306 / DSM 6799 / DCB-1) TaxID=706587 RepID=I4C224_DESTA|nr:cob(I)yrinic acid a,c-diamide adenosyltransferase [Desulfomonile tiedjei]AFM23615.1 ATP:corrinoid adenosyltransferase [Desulfomonile tiedjei DSM 6799]
MCKKGRIRVLTGEGKGKTTSALGIALQFAGVDKKVYMVQFIKRPDSSGEHFAVQALGSWLTLKPVGTRGFILKRKPAPEEKLEARLALDNCREAMLSGEYGLVILDEANVAVHKELLELEVLLDFIKSKPEEVELVITGRYAHEDVISLADQVLEMRKCKHHYETGHPAARGVDF